MATSKLIPNSNKFVINLLAYALIVLLLYFLYSPENSSEKNKTGSTTEFVYQQF